MKYKDYYKILEIDKKADSQEIKKAFRRLAKKYHPDMNQNNPEAEKKFKDVNEAYEVLSDPKKKEQYDTFGSYGSFNGGDNFDPSQYGYGSYTSSSQGGFSDFFNLIFGDKSFDQGFSGASSSYKDIFSSFGKKTKRREVSLTLSLSIEEAYKGVQKSLSVKLDGEKKLIKVNVPKGITANKKLKVKGEKFDIKDTDLSIKINILDGTFRLDGLDLYKKIEITPWDAYLGSSVSIESLDGKIRVKLPENSRSGQKIRLAKKGYVDMDGKTGNLILEIQINNPSEMDDRLIEVYKALKEENK